MGVFESMEARANVVTSLQEWEFLRDLGFCYVDRKFATMLGRYSGDWTEGVEFVATRPSSEGIAMVERIAVGFSKEFFIVRRLFLGVTENDREEWYRKVKPGVSAERTIEGIVKFHVRKVLEEKR